MKFRDNIFAVEGGVGSGKTTVARGLAVEHNFLFIAEYMQMVKDHDAFFKASPEDRLVRLIDLEKVRQSWVADAPRNQLVLLDRSVLCLFAHEYAKGRMQIEYENEKIPELIDQIELIPSSIFFLTATENVRRERCALRITKMGELFFDEEYNSLIASFYHQLQDQLLIHFIDTTDLTTQETSERVYSLMLHQKTPRPGLLRKRILSILDL